MREDFADSLAGEWAPGPRSRVDEASGSTVVWMRMRTRNCRRTCVT